MATKHTFVFIFLTLIGFGSGIETEFDVFKFVQTLVGWKASRKGPPKCSRPTIVNEGSISNPDYRIVMNCTLPDDVYSRPTCKYFWKRIYEDSKRKSKRVDIANNALIISRGSPRTPFVGSCKLFLNVSSLRRGSFVFGCFFPANDDDYKPYVSTSVIKLEPPPAPPSLSINDGQPIPNGQTVNVSAGHNITIKCHVKGGYPKVSQTTLTTSDGKKRWMWPRSYSSLTLTVTKDIDKNGVNCSALHVSGSYHEEAYIIFNVQWGAEITMFAVKNFTDLFGKQEVEVGVDSILELECFAKGKPIPYTVSIQKRLGQVVHQRLSLFGNTLVATYGKKASCKDTGWYTCTAFNGVDSPASEDVLILVKCPLELGFDDRQEDNKHIFKTVDESRVNVEFNILGFPKPNRHYLYKIDAQSDEDVEQRKKYIDMQSGRYNITFFEVDELHSKLELTIYNMVDNGDTGQYGLEIGNGIGKDLVITFQIVTNNGVADGVPLALIIGVVCGVLLFIIIIVITCILVRKCIKKKKRPVTIPQSANNQNSGEKYIPKSTSSDHHDRKQDSNVYEEMHKENPDYHGLKTSTEESGYVDLIDSHEYVGPMDHLQKKSNIPRGSTYENYERASTVHYETMESNVYDKVREYDTAEEPSAENDDGYDQHIIRPRVRIETEASGYVPMNFSQETRHLVDHQKKSNIPLANIYGNSLSIDPMN